MHPTPQPDSTQRSRHRRSCRQVFFGTFLFCVCMGWLLVGCERQANATRATAGSTTTAAVDTQTEPVTAVANASPIRLEPPALDFGPIQKGSTAEATVRLINSSDRAVRVLQAKTSCSCTVADFSKEPFDPGQFIEVTVRFKPGGKVGATPKRTVRFRLEGEFAPVPLSVTGKIVQFVTIDSSRLQRPIARNLPNSIRSGDGGVARVLTTIHSIVFLNVRRPNTTRCG